MGSAPLASSEVVHAAALELAAAWPERGRHDAFLALAGGLAMYGWPEDAITELTTMVARFMTNSDEKAVGPDRAAQAASSVAAVLRGDVVAGWGSLAPKLTRPEVADSVRAKLGMREASIDMAAGLNTLLGVNPTAPPALSDGYPASLAAIDTYTPPAAPVVAAIPGTFLAHLQQAAIEVGAALGKTDVIEERAMFISARDLFTMTFPPTPWLIQGIIPDKGVGAILAEAKSTKTWLAMEFAMSVASGTPALGKYGVPNAKKTAYFFAEEMAPSLRNRLKAFAAGRGMRPEDLTANLHVQPRGRNLDLTKVEDVARVVASCRAIGGVGFLILDPLRDVQSGKENDSDDMSVVFKHLKLIGNLLDCTVLIVHHAKRNKKENEQDENRPGTDARGSSAIEGALDSILSMRDLRGNGVDEFSNTIVTQIKNGKSAGTFRLTLKITDDKDGQCERAVWTVGGDAPGKVDGQSFDELVVACLEHMLESELKKDRAQTNEMIRKAVHRKNDQVSAAMIQAERDGFALKHLIGTRQVGWVLTQRGRDHVYQANQPVQQDPPVASPAPAPTVTFMTIPELTRNNPT